jgi:hypothetical protein
MALNDSSMSSTEEGVEPSEALKGGAILRELIFNNQLTGTYRT